MLDAQQLQVVERAVLDALLTSHGGLASGEIRDALPMRFYDDAEPTLHALFMRREVVLINGRYHHARSSNNVVLHERYRYGQRWTPRPRGKQP